MLATAVVAALSFSAPPSLTRRDMMMGMGAAAAVVANGPMPAFAKETAAERQAKLQETLKALDFKLDPAVKSLQASTFNPNAVNTFTPTGQNRKATDPNLKGGDKDAWLKKYGY